MIRHIVERPTTATSDFAAARAIVYDLRIASGRTGPSCHGRQIKAIINPALIMWARNSAGFTVAEAAQKLGIEERHLAAWEDPKVDEGPSIPQLRKLAALFKRPLAVFYLPDPPKNFAVMRDLRRLPATGIRRYSPALQMEIRTANERRELALELAADLEEEFPKFTLTATDDEDPEQVGERIRATFGVTVQLQSQRRDNDGRAGFNGWRHKIEDAGVLVFQSDQIPIRGCIRVCHRCRYAPGNCGQCKRRSGPANVELSARISSPNARAGAAFPIW